MLTARIPKKPKTAAGTLQPVLPLIPETLPTLDEDKAQFISLELKTRAGGPAGQTYKKYVRKFEEGTPQQWIDLLRDVEEIWTQNAINGGTDRTATIRSLLRGESLTAFNTALEEARVPEEEGAELLAINQEIVATALKAVTKSVFPHRALEIQKLWMQRGMKKPYNLSTRKTAAAITRINNALPLFPEGSEESKFSTKQIVELLEWCLPQAWRTKFDLDGYVPTHDSKARLIEACEAIERHQKEEADSTSKKQKGKDKKDGKSTSGKKNSGDKTFYCSLHGKNSTHDSVDCFSLKKKQAGNNGNAKSSNKDGKAHSFSNRAFRKEINLLACNSSKKEVLEMYATALAREQAKLAKQAKKRKQCSNNDAESDSDMSVDVMEVIPPPPKKPALKKANKKKVSFSEKTAEEEAFLKQIQAASSESAGEESSEDST